MKKLRIALGLVFALTFSLFLVACGGGSGEVTEIVLEGGTRTFTEGEAFSTGDLSVTVYYRGSDDAVVLDSEQYEVDSSAYDPNSAGTYQIIITPDQTPADGAQPVTASYEVTVEHNWVDEGGGNYSCTCGAARQSLTGLTDTITTTAWGNQASLANVSADSPAVAPIAGENHVNYGSLVAGQSRALTMKILTVDVSATWNTPLMGIRNGADGTLPREDAWVIATAAGFVSPWGTSTGYAPSLGTATADSTLWEVFSRGTNWNAADLVDGTLVITYDYSLDSVMTIRHNLTKADGSTLELIYSVHVPDAAYEIVAYGEKVTYQVTNIETVMNRYVTGFTAELPDATVQPEGKMFDTTGITTEATMSKGNPVSNSYNAYAYIDVTDAEGNVTPTRVNLATEPLQAGMYAFNVEFAGQVYYFTSDGTIDGTSQITVVPSSFTAVGASAVSKGGVVFDAPNASFDYAVNAAEDGIDIIGTGTAAMLTAAQKEALGTTASSFVAFKLSALSDGVTAVSVSDGGYAALVNGVIDVVLPLGANYTITITSGEETQTVAVDLSEVAAPAAGAYVAASDFTLDAGGTYTVVYTGDFGNIDELSLVTGGKVDTVADIEAEISSDGRYTALRNQLYINSVTETADGFEVVYDIAAPAIVNLAANNASRAVGLRGADGTTLASLTLYYNMTFSADPTGSYARISDDTVVFVSRDMMYVIKGVTGESVDGNLEYTDLFIDATLNIQNEVGQSYDVSVSTSADGVAPDASNTITSSVSSTGKIIALGNVGDATDYDYGALIMYQFSVTLLGLRTDDNAATYYFTANEDTENGQETYTVYTVTGDEITAAEVTPTGERAEMQAFSCVQDGIEAYTDAETGFVYGAIVTPATGVHTWGAETEGVATCEVCGATKETVAIDENSYYEVVLLKEGNIFLNNTADGWWVVDYQLGKQTVSGDFVMKYTWNQDNDPNYVSDGAFVISLADGSTTDDLRKRFLEGATDNAWTAVANVNNSLWTNENVSYVIYHNGEEAAYPENALDQTNKPWNGDYSFVIRRLGTTLTVEESLTTKAGDVWTSELVIGNFTEADLSVAFWGNPYYTNNNRVTVGEVTRVMDFSGDANKKEIGAISTVTTTGISVSATILGHSGDWGTLVMQPASGSGMLVTLPNLDPYNNTTGEFPTGLNAFPAGDDFVGEGATWDCFFNAATPYYLTVSLSVEDGVKYYRDGELMIWYKANRLMGGSTYISDFVEYFLNDIAESGFTFMAATAEGATTTDLHIQGAVSDAEALALYQAQAE